MLQHEGGCVQCGALREITPENRFGATTQIVLNALDEQKIVVGCCKKCYDAGNFDLPLIQKNLVLSEKDWAQKRNLNEGIDKFEKMEFTGWERYLK